MTLAEAAARLDASAHAVVRTWRLVVVGVTSFVLLWSGLAIMSLALGRLLYVPVFGLMVVMSGYNVTRFIPRPVDEPVRGVALSPADVVSVRERLQAPAGGHVPEQVHLTAEPLVRLDRTGVLLLGLPLAMCLDAEDVGLMVEDAAAVHEVLRRPAVARALAVAEGGLGRGLRDGRRRTSLGFLRAIDLRAAAFHDALGDYAQADRTVREPDRAPVDGRGELAVEAWLLVLHTWVLPAAGEGRLVRGPFSGARDLVSAATSLGLTDAAVPADTPLLDRRQAEAYEDAVTRTLLDQTDELEPVAWADHGSAVLVPRWRRAVARGLVAVTQSVGEPRPATLGTFLDVLEGGWGEALAARLRDPLVASDEGIDPLPDLLVAATWLAVLEAPGATVSWSWPYGPELFLPDRGLLDVQALVAAGIRELGATGDLSELRRGLGEVGVDVDTPIWLDEGAAESDRVLASTLASTGWRKWMVVVFSERSVRLFEDSYLASTRRDVRMQMVGAHEVLQPIMDSLETGEARQPEAEVLVRDVVHAELVSVLGGMYWRLSLWTPDDRFKVVGTGETALVEEVLRLLVGDRLTTRWLHVPPRLQAVRLWTVVLLVGLGGTLVLSGPIAWLMGETTLADGLVVTAIGLACVLLVLVPGGVMALVARRQRARRTGRGVERHAGRHSR